jgi:hypothetical protein
MEVVEVTRSRHTPDQIVRKLREADRLLAEGVPIPEVCRHLENSVATYQRWRYQYSAMRPDDVAKLKNLEKKNARLKRLLAEKSWTTTCCGRWRGENGDPEATPDGGRLIAGSLRGLRETSVPGPRPATLDPAPPAHPRL